MPEAIDSRQLAHLLWDVSARASSFVEGEMSPTGLTPASHGVLDLIAANPGTSIVEMTRTVPTSVQAISQIVARMEKRGYVERRAGPRGRSVALYLTAEGDQAREAAEARLIAATDRIRSLLGAREYDQLVGLLARTRSRFDQLEGLSAASVS